MKTYLCVCLLIGLLNNTICFANDFLLDSIKEIYQYETWSGTTKTNYQKIIKNKPPEFNNFGTTNIAVQNGEISSDGFLESFYIFKTTNMPDDVYLRVYETSSVLDAHEALMFFFNNCSAIQPFQTGKSIGVNLGDHCFAGYPMGATNSLFFVRNNVFIDITSGSSVYEIANKIDQQLLSSSLLP